MGASRAVTTCETRTNGSAVRGSARHGKYAHRRLGPAATISQPRTTKGCPTAATTTTPSDAATTDASLPATGTP